MSGLVGLPAVGSRWRYPPWNNPEYTGPWEVEAVGVPGEEAVSVVALRRVAAPPRGGRRLRHETPTVAWPGSWVPA